MDKNCIRYDEKNGKIFFEYLESMKSEFSENQCLYKFSGEVPEEVLERGEEDIRKYAVKKVRAGIRKQNAQWKKHREFEKNMNFPVETEYDGKKLIGRIFFANSRCIKVRLEEPFRGEGSRNFGWSSAMVGRNVFSGTARFSLYAMDAAKNILVEIYKAKKNEGNKDLSGLVERLNQGEK